jgi:predicted DNA-binding protein YlxM (UPF0122 family)
MKQFDKLKKELKPKTKKNEQVVKLWNNGERNFSEIARKVGTTRQYVHLILKKLGHKGTGRRPNHLDKVKKIKQLAELGYTAKEIVAQTGVKLSTLNVLKHKYNILITDGHTKYKKDFLINLYIDSDCHYATMAKTLGIKLSNIYRIMKHNGLETFYPNKRKKRGSKNQEVNQVNS